MLVAHMASITPSVVFVASLSAPAASSTSAVAVWPCLLAQTSGAVIVLRGCKQHLPPPGRGKRRFEGRNRSRTWGVHASPSWPGRREAIWRLMYRRRHRPRPPLTLIHLCVSRCTHIRLKSSCCCFVVLVLVPVLRRQYAYAYVLILMRTLTVFFQECLCVSMMLPRHVSLPSLSLPSRPE